MMNAGLLDLDPQIHPAYHHGKQKGVSFLPQTHLYHNGSDEEEECSLTNDLLGKPKKSLPWQRMKWTDNMVRLLISTVASVKDDGMNSLSTRLPPSISQSNYLVSDPSDGHQPDAGRGGENPRA